MKKWILPVLLLIIGLCFLTLGLYVGETDDSPGAGGLGMILMGLFTWLSWRVWRKSKK